MGDITHSRSRQHHAGPETFHGGSAAAQPPAGVDEPLWREALGARLRRLRKKRGLILTQLADRAGLSAQYLSEIERGRKDPSSEMLAAISGALALPLVDLTEQVLDELKSSRLTVVDFARHAQDDASSVRPSSGSRLYGMDHGHPGYPPLRSSTSSISPYSKAA